MTEQKDVVETVEAVETEEVAVQAVPEAKVDEVIRNHVYGSIGVGLVPVPLLDIAGLMGVQLNLARRLCELYGVPFKESLAKKVVVSLIGSLTPVALTPVAYSLLKIVPVVGTTTSAVSLSALGGAATYAVGRVFADHLAKGGTIETLNAQSVKEDFAKAYESGKTVVKECAQKAKCATKATDTKVEAKA